MGFLGGGGSLLRNKSQGSGKMVPQPVLHLKQTDVEISRFLTPLGCFPDSVFRCNTFPLFARIKCTPADHTHLQGETQELGQGLKSPSTIPRGTEMKCHCARPVQKIHISFRHCLVIVKCVKQRQTRQTNKKQQLQI